MTSRAVSRSGDSRGPGVFGVEPDRFDDQVKLIGAVDFARHTVGLARHELVGFAEVMQPINTLGVAVEQQEHRTRPVLFPREQEQVIGAEVEHGKKRRREREITLSRPIGSAVEGFTRRTPPVMGYRTERRLRRARVQEVDGGLF